MDEEPGGLQCGGHTVEHDRRLKQHQGDLNIFRSCMKTIYVDLGFDKAEREEDNW